MKRILVGIASNRHDQRFWDSFMNFMKRCHGHYDIGAVIIKDTFLPDAQNDIAKSFLGARYDYLLLLDDDHWGHSKEMLDCLVGADTYMATMKTYSRHYPYSVAVWDRIQGNLVIPAEGAEGYRPCDLTGFPMTLISRETFRLLEEPYFRPVEAEGRTWNTDIDFCLRLGNIGIKPVACFQHCLNHDKITEDNVREFRRAERFKNNNIAWSQMLQDIENGVFLVK